MEPAHPAPEVSGYLTYKMTQWGAVKGLPMRFVFAFGAVAALTFGLSGCAVVSAGAAVVSAGASVGASVVGTAADLAGDAITAPFPVSDSDKKKD